jgi:hypothetical protein
LHLHPVLREIQSVQ